MSTLDNPNYPETDWDIDNKTCPEYSCEDPYITMYKDIKHELISMGYDYYVEKPMFYYVCEKLGIDPDEIDLNEFETKCDFSIE